MTTEEIKENSMNTDVVKTDDGLTPSSSGDSHSNSRDEGFRPVRKFGSPSGRHGFGRRGEVKDEFETKQSIQNLEKLFYKLLG